MSTTWYVPVGPYVKNAELEIRKMTGWKKVQCEENTKYTQVLTDGYYFAHCDRKPIKIIDHGQFVTLELFGENQNLGEVLGQIDDAVNDDDNSPVINCDNCGEYVMIDELYVDTEESVLCRKCGKKECDRCGKKLTAKDPGISYEYFVTCKKCASK